METVIKPLNGTGDNGAAAGLLKQVVPPEPPPSFPRAKRAAVGLLALAAIGAGAFLWLDRGWVATDDANIEAHVVAISPRVPGHIARLLVDDNQKVQKGDVLAEIDPRDYQTQRDKAQGDVDAAEAAARRARLDLVRYEHLAPQGAAPRQLLDHARADAGSAEAALETARAQLRQAELNLSYTRIEAPQSGRVTRRTVEEGAFVGVGQSLLAIVPSEVWVVANFKETQLRGMRPGQKAEIKIDAYPGKIPGRVDSLQAGTGARFSVLPAENATGNFVKVVQRMPVKIVLERSGDSGRLLAPGMSVEAEVEVR